MILSSAEISPSLFGIDKNLLDMSMASNVRMMLEIKVSKNILVNISWLERY